MKQLQQWWHFYKYLTIFYNITLICLNEKQSYSISCFISESLGSGKNEQARGVWGKEDPSHATQEHCCGDCLPGGRITAVLMLVHKRLLLPEDNPGSQRRNPEEGSGTRLSTESFILMWCLLYVGSHSFIFFYIISFRIWQKLHKVSLEICTVS